MNVRINGTSLVDIVARNDLVYSKNGTYVNCINDNEKAYELYKRTYAYLMRFSNMGALVKKVDKALREAVQLIYPEWGKPISTSKMSKNVETVNEEASEMKDDMVTI